MAVRPAVSIAVATASMLLLAAAAVAAPQAYQRLFTVLPAVGGSAAQGICRELHAKAFNAGVFEFPNACGASGSLTIPSFTQTGSGSEFGMKDFLCVGPRLLHKKQFGEYCYAQQNPTGHCTQAANTFWFVEVGFMARTLDGYGGENIQFDSNAFPVSFSSSTLIKPGKRYGLCVIASGGVMQDDFAGKRGTKASGNTVNLTMTLSSQFIAFFRDEGFEIYLESN
jgi:hypothetical protein